MVQHLIASAISLGAPTPAERYPGCRSLCPECSPRAPRGAARDVHNLPARGVIAPGARGEPAANDGAKEVHLHYSSGLVRGPRSPNHPIAPVMPAFVDQCSPPAHPTGKPEDRRLVGDVGTQCMQLVIGKSNIGLWGPGVGEANVESGSYTCVDVAARRCLVTRR